MADNINPTELVPIVPGVPKPPEVNSIALENSVNSAPVPDATLANELAKAEQPVNAAEEFDKLMQKAGANGASEAQGDSMRFAQTEGMVYDALSAIPPIK